MPTRKDKTDVVPIYREQVFIPASGATLMKQKARPKVAGRPVSSGVIEIVSPEFDLLTGVRGIANLPKGFLKTNKLPQGENLYYRQLDKTSKGLERAKQVGVIDTKSSGGANFTTSRGTTLRIGKTFDTPFFAKGSLWYNNVDDMDVIVGKDNPLLDWKMITQHGRVTENTMKAANRRTPFYNGATNQAPTELFELYRRYPGIGYRNVTHGFPTIPITGLNTITEQMKCGGRRKAQLGLDIREGGIAIPIANNMFYIEGRKHAAGGVAIGPNNKNGVEVEGGEVVEMIDSKHPSVGRQFAAGGQNQTMRVFSSVPLLRGVSPAQLVMGGANPNDVFKAQEEFKDRNRINDDGTRYQNGGKKKYNSAIRTEDDKNVSIRNRAIYSAVDSTSDYPKWWQAIGLGIGSNIKAITNPDNMNYNVIDSVADAAWRKRLGLSYDNKFLIPNKDGSVRLPKNVEMEIPTDTTMLKRRIASNEQFANQNNIMGEDWKIVQAMIDKDKEALDALRTTYKTGKPVVINEYAHNSRNLSKNGELIKDAINYKSPLNVMKNYTIQYDPKNKSMNYWDTYDFNEFEWGVPGKPFEIKGNIPLKKVGGIYIKPSKRGTFTAAATKRGMGVQEFASKVLANKEDYSPAMVKKANFARNANRWKKEYGGNMIYTINGNVKNGLSLRPKAQYGKQTIIRNNKEWEYDEKSGAFVPVKYVTKYKTIAGRTYKKEPNSKNYVEVTDSVEKAKLNKPKEAIVKQNNKSESNKESPAKENKYVSTTKSNTGESYIINPLTGEWIRNGVTETSEPSVKGTTKVTSKSSSTPRGRGTKASTPKAAVKTTTKGADVKYGTPLKEKKESLYITGIKNNSITPLRAGMEKIKSPSSTGGGTQSKEAPLVPQYNLITGRDWLGVGTNFAGHIASYFANNSLLKKVPMPTKPVSFQAAKLKITHNINPELANIDEVTQMNLAEVGRNTSSSSTNLARKQRIMNEARDARNKLYGQKENIETQLINLDRRNRQDVYNRNIAAYNDWLDKTYVAKSNNLLNKQRNLTNLISGIPMAVNTMLGTIESRKSTNDMIQAISASRPNVDGRLLGIGDYYSQKLPDGRTAIYNKNHKLVKYV